MGKNDCTVVVNVGMRRKVMHTNIQYIRTVPYLFDSWVERRFPNQLSVSEIFEGFVPCLRVFEDFVQCCLDLYPASEEV